MLKRVLAPVVLGGLLLVAASTPAFAARTGGGRMNGPAMMHRGGGSGPHMGSGHFRHDHDFFRDRDFPGGLVALRRDADPAWRADTLASFGGVSPAAVRYGRRVDFESTYQRK